MKKLPVAAAILGLVLAVSTTAAAQVPPDTSAVVLLRAGKIFDSERGTMVPDHLERVRFVMKRGEIVSGRP